MRDDAANPQPLTLTEVLAAEYASLRPGGVEGAAAGESLEALREEVHAAPEPLAALCISGGGIRSATFALGAVQGLAKAGMLQRFDYLSTVSGGGYLGGWLSAWCARVEQGIAQVSSALKASLNKPPAADGQVDPVAHLRAYNSYLSPKQGSMSDDTWSLAATIVRNMALNWLVALPLLCAVLLLPHVFVQVVHLLSPPPDALSPPGGLWASALSTSAGALGLISALCFTLGIFSILRLLPAGGDDTKGPQDYLPWVWLPMFVAVLAYLPAAYQPLPGTPDAATLMCQTDATPARLLKEVVGRLWPLFFALLAFLGWLRLKDRPVRNLGIMAVSLLSLAVGTGLMGWLAIDVLPLLRCDPAATPRAIVGWELFVTTAPPMLWTGGLVGNLLFVGLSSRWLQDDDREWLARHEGILLRTSLLWLMVSGAVLIVPPLVEEQFTAALGGLGGVAAISGWLLRYGLPLLSPPSTASPSTAPPRSLLALLLAAAPAIFIVALVLGLALSLHLLLGALASPYITDSMSAREVAGIRALLALTLCLGLAAFGWVFSHFVDANKFSLHGMYRDRLVRAYLGASNTRAKANPFSGFAVDDDLPMHTLRARPLHVVNTALNVLRTDQLAWQQRKAQPFSITRLHCGNKDLGYRPARHYGAEGGISLGTAISISGAAASPSMGAGSTPSHSFVLAFLNARLGAWMGNPGPRGETAWRERGPTPAAAPIVREALGLTSNDSPFVYLSDGGHFENLALYEMVLRRCHAVLLLDGGCDPTLSLEDLGNALRKIRIDQGIDIQFAPGAIERLTQRKQRWAVARIGYTAVDGPRARDGWLVYVKPMLTGEEPPDVRQYASSSPSFPHETTADQWFNESQTESYRALGTQSIDDLVHGLGLGPDTLAQRAEAAWMEASRTSGEPGKSSS